jgi:U3 small nucleolar RNA-associated protein 22
MKRKRQPTPHSNKIPLNETRVIHTDHLPEAIDASERDNEIFNGFSEDDSEDDEQVQLAVEKVEANADVNGYANRPSKKQKKSVPTQEELMNMLFQSNSFQSNLFKLQVDELLSEVRVRYEKMDNVERFLHRLKDILTQLPESEDQLVAPLMLFLIVVAFLRI